MLAMILTLQELGAERDIYLYDTFEGMTAPSRARRLATRSARERTWAEAEAAGRAGLERDVRTRALQRGRGAPDAAGDRLPAEERLHFVRGPVEETLPEHAPGALALLRLDTDWYESTRHELEHLYPLLDPGGVLIIDDYGHWEGARRAVDEYFAANGGAAAAEPDRLHRPDRRQALSGFVAATCGLPAGRSQVARSRCARRRSQAGCHGLFGPGPSKWRMPGRRRARRRARRPNVPLLQSRQSAFMAFQRGCRARRRSPSTRFRASWSGHSSSGAAVGDHLEQRADHAVAAHLVQVHQQHAAVEVDLAARGARASRDGPRWFGWNDVRHGGQPVARRGRSARAAPAARRPACRRRGRARA